MLPVVHQHPPRAARPDAAPHPRVADRVWVRAEQFFRRGDTRRHCWVWARTDAGRVHALRLEAAQLGNEASLLHFLHLAETHPERDELPADAVHGAAVVLHGAPAVPVTRWSVSWGQPLQQAIRRFAAALDAGTLEALAALETQGRFLATVDNYNRIALRPARSRRRRLQALALFPPLVLPLLLDRYSEPNMIGDGDYGFIADAELPADAADPVLAAMDEGRDLIGALARHWRIDRALVRSPLMRQPWRHDVKRHRALALLRALPAHARPHKPQDLEDRLELLHAFPGAAVANPEQLVQPFRKRWTRTWRALEASTPHLRTDLVDTRDFATGVLHHDALPEALASLDPETLLLAWWLRRGPASLLRASARWHAQPLLQVEVDDGFPEELPALVGALELEAGTAQEITTRAGLIAEGEAMHHCVGSYWDDCVTTGMRIVHLELRGATPAEALKATAEYDWEPLDDDRPYRLAALRGPCNQEPSVAMADFAATVGARINAAAAACGVETWDAEIDAISRRANAAGTSCRRELRALDARTRTELAQVCARIQRHLPHAGPALYRGPVAGWHYSHGPRIHDRLHVGAALTLAREPANPHDPRAVRVAWRGRQIGYLPRSENAAIARLLDRGATLETRITRVHPRGDSGSGVEITVARTGDQARPAQPHRPARVRP